MGLRFTDKCMGYVQMTSVNTATGITFPASVGATDRPNLVIVIPEAQAVRWRDDGIAPTATVGMPLAAGSTLAYDGDLNKVQFIGQAAGAILNLAFYN